MLQFISRKKTLISELEKAECPLPSPFKGYILMRDAKLPDKAWDTMDTWSHGTYEYDEVATNLRKLDDQSLDVVAPPISLGCQVSKRKVQKSTSEAPQVSLIASPLSVLQAHQ